MAKITTYDATKSINPQLSMPRSQAMDMVFQAQNSVVNNLTELGSTIINIDDTMRGAQATGDIINKGSMLDSNKIAQLSRLYDGYQMDRLQNLDTANEKLNQMATMIDPEGALVEKLGGLQATTRDKALATAYQKLTTNHALKVKDPGEFYLRRPDVLAVTKGDGTRTDERDEAMIDEQIKHGVSPSKVNVLTNTEAKAMVTSLMSEPDPDKARMMWQNIVQDPQYDRVLRQLGENGLPSSLKMLAHIDIRYNTAIFNALKITDDQVTDYYAGKVDRNPNDIKEAVDPVIEDFFNALTGGNMMKQMAITPDIRTMAEKLTFTLMTTQNLSEANAAQKAVDIIKEGFDIQDDDVGQYVLPKAQGLDADLIHDRLTGIKYNPLAFDKMWKEISPKIPGTALESLQLDIESRGMIFKEFVQENMRFVNADDTGDGFYILLDMPNAALAQPLADELGRPITIGFKQLEKYSVPSIFGDD